MIVGLAINWSTDILLTSFFFTTVIVACTINLSTDLVQESWMGFTDVSTIVTIINEWSKTLALQFVSANMLFFDVDEINCEC